MIRLLEQPEAIGICLIATYKGKLVIINNQSIMGTPIEEDILEIAEKI